MKIAPLRLGVHIILILVVLSGALIFYFSEVQKAASLEIYQNEAKNNNISHLGLLINENTLESLSPAEKNPLYNFSGVRDFYGMNGTGVKIGIISDGVDNLAEVQASGELPPDVYVLSNRIRGQEGTAMLEIIHNIAPGAELYFHACGTTKLEFNNALDALIDQRCTIICDDIGWLSEPFFEDGIVASHVRKVIKDNDILYVSAAGNSGKNHYQGVFHDNGSSWHDFSEGKKEEKNLRLHIQPSGKIRVFLEWDDKWEDSGNNYDLFLVDGDTSEILTSSEMNQDGNDLPLEYITYTNKKEKALNASLQIRKTGGEERELELFIYRWQGVTVSSENIVPEDSIFGHPALPEVLTVGAVNPGESGTYKPENFSSRGPVTLVYPFREIRPKPDLSGISGINVTGSGGIPRKLHGTSASAPYAAGIACLIGSAFPEKSSMDIKRLLCSSAIDLEKPGYDTVFGYGLADAVRAYELAAREPRTFTVNKNGNEDFTSVTDAVNSSNPGDTVLVFPGTYKENVDIPWALSIKADSRNPYDTILKTANPEKPVIHVTGNSVNISGLSVKGSNESVGVYLESASNCTLENNVISGCMQGILLEEAFNNTLIQNNISNNAQGINLTASFLNRIEKNELDNAVNINETHKGEAGLLNSWNTSAEMRYRY